MSHIERVTLAQSLAAKLSDEIQAGTWSGNLPGYRVLGLRYGVSQPTCMTALEILAREGVIARVGERRPWRILADHGPTTGGIKRGYKILWFGETEEDVMEPSTRAVLSVAMRECRDCGGRVSLEISRTLRSTRASAVANRLIKRHKPDRVILHNAPKQMIAAIVKTGVPVFMLGGELSPTFEVEGMGHSLEATCRRIGIDAIRMGRPRILFPVPVGFEGWRKDILRGLVKAGLVNAREGDKWVPWIDDSFPGALRDFWHAQLTRLKPDIIVTLGAPWLLSLYSAAWQTGLRPGEDFLAVTTDSPELLRWLDPSPTLLQLPIKTMQKHLVRWLRTPDPSRGHRFLEMRWPKMAK